MWRRQVDLTLVGFDAQAHAACSPSGHAAERGSAAIMRLRPYRVHAVVGVRDAISVAAAPATSMVSASQNRAGAKGTTCPASKAITFGMTEWQVTRSAPSRRSGYCRGNRLGIYQAECGSQQ